MAYVFEPKEDITVYELAKIVQAFFTADWARTTDLLGTGIRHFRNLDEKEE